MVDIHSSARDCLILLPFCTLMIVPLPIVTDSGSSSGSESDVKTATPGKSVKVWITCYMLDICILSGLEQFAVFFLLIGISIYRSL